MIVIQMRDTKIVVEALGDDQLISLIKELFPVLQAPLMELFAQVMPIIIICSKQQRVKSTKQGQHFSIDLSVLKVLPKDNQHR